MCGPEKAAVCAVFAVRRILGMMRAVKKAQTPGQLAAMASARKRGYLMAFLALLIGALMAYTTTDLLQLHCAMAIGVAIAGGMAAALVAAPIDPGSVRQAGSTGGMFAGLGFAVPFIVFNILRWAGTDASAAGRRLAELTPAELASMARVGILLNDGASAAEYFRSQDLSYVFGYLLFSLFLGWLFGMVGAALARRRTKPKSGLRGGELSS
jgi:hypothetical protein